ncbi:ABC transporter ATP-binding protein [Polaromonas jejuensis]|uniref:ATP-binding cassette domain-containing protein n=1 Tax=Polaromonas jejuensis TaxID=457502 RepID=A0ABW0QB98_9BURK|nr:ATP-binding cassette domain-containing protein [Polaromonas jejuensis]
MPHTTPVLQADGLSFGHGHGTLFAHLSVLLPSGVTLVCGDEGVGKTTLLRLLAGVLPLTTGELQIRGLRLADQPDAYRRQVSWFDPRDPALDERTASQIFNTLPQRHPGHDADALQTHIDGLSLAPHLDKPLLALSSGTRRKVLMAAALASQASVTLLDQPFMALDRPSIAYLLGVLAEAARHPNRAWVVADYVAPESVPLAQVIELAL